MPTVASTITRPAPDPAIVRSRAYHIREVKVPFRDPGFRPVADRNCVTAVEPRSGSTGTGEQREANGQSVG
jgi:hypothetical protein